MTYLDTDSDGDFVSDIQLEILKVKEQQNHFALKARLYLKAIKAAFSELQELKKCNPKKLSQRTMPLLA